MNDAGGLMHERVAHRDPPRIAFLFTGQGAQYAGMTKGLYDVSQVFRAALDRCAAILRPYLDRPLLDVLFTKDTGAAQINQTVYTQPALFAVEFALTELWRSWGVTPTAVIGHSVGEYVAACVAGVFSLQDGLRLVALRGQLMQSLPTGGAMAAVFAPEALVAPMIVPHAATLSIAGANGPSQTVISGDAAAVEEVCRRLEEQGVQVHALPVSHAFHSPLVEPVLDQFELAARSVQFAAPRIRLISNVTGRLAVADEITQPSYWRRHMREAVRFGDGLRALEDARPDCCIEIGPHPALLPLVGSAFAAAPPRLIASLRRGNPDWEHMLEGLSAVYRAGAKVDWRGLSDAGKDRIVDLPYYPFQRERYWFQSRGGTPPSARPGSHALLGVRLRSAIAGSIYEATISADTPGFVRHHRVLDHIILPATAYLEMFVAGARDVLRTEAVRIEDVTISEAMLLADDGGARIVQTVFEFEPRRDCFRFRQQRCRNAGRCGVLGTTCGGARHHRRSIPAANQNLVRTAGPMSVASRGGGLLRRVQGTRAAIWRRFPYCPSGLARYRPGGRGGCAFRGFGGTESGLQIASAPAGRMLAASCCGPPARGAGNTLFAGRDRFLPALRRSRRAVLVSCRRPADRGGLLPRRRARVRCRRRAGRRTAADSAQTGDARCARTHWRALARRLPVSDTVATGRNRTGKRRSARPRRATSSLGGSFKAARMAGVRRPCRRGGRTRGAQGGTGRPLHAGISWALRRAGRRDSRSIRPATDDYRRLLLEVRAAGRAVDGVIHAWSLDSCAWDGMTGADLAEAQACSAISPLLLAQALVAEASPPRLWIVTRGGQQADGSERSVSPVQAAAWGLGRSIALEHPELNCVCIDLDPGPHPTEAEALVAELASDRDGGAGRSASGRAPGRAPCPHAARW